LSEQGWINFIESINLNFHVFYNKISTNTAQNNIMNKGHVHNTVYLICIAEALDSSSPQTAFSWPIPVDTAVEQGAKKKAKLISGVTLKAALSATQPALIVNHKIKPHVSQNSSDI